MQRVGGPGQLCRGTDHRRPTVEGRSQSSHSAVYGGGY